LLETSQVFQLADHGAIVNRDRHAAFLSGPFSRAAPEGDQRQHD
jgi:hypothetical protein